MHFHEAAPSVRPSRLTGCVGALLAVVATLAVLCGVVSVVIVCSVAPRLAQRPRALRASQAIPLPVVLFSLNQIADPAANRRVNPYIRGCLNRFSPFVLSGRDYYLAWTGGSLPPVDARPTEFVIKGLSADPADCEEALREAASVDPPDPALEAAGRRYLRAVRAAGQTLNEAERYYHDHDWEDDRMARGRAMHPAILAAFEDFGRAHAELAARVAAAQQASPAPRCERQAEVGPLTCQAARHLRLARRVTLLCAAATVADDGTIAGLDVPRLATEVAALEASMRRFLADAERPGAYMHEEVYPSGYTWDAAEHLRQVKILYRAARDHDRVDAEAWSTPGSEPSGSPAGVIVAFNHAVSDFNFVP